MSVWNGKVHGDIGQAFEQHARLDEGIDRHGVRRLLVQVVRAWTVHHKDGVILAVASGFAGWGVKQCAVIEFFSGVRSADGTPSVAIKFAFPDSMAKARCFFGPDEEMKVVKCTLEAFDEISKHLIQFSRTNHLIDIRSGAKLYEGLVTVIPVPPQRNAPLSPCDVTPVRSGNSNRSCAVDEWKQEQERLSGWNAVWGSTVQSLALFRVTLGLLLTLELILRYRFLHPFYSDEGTLPTHLLLDRVDAVYKSVCLHCHYGEEWQQQLLLTLQVALALCFTLGVGPRISAIASWYLYLSLTLRNTWMSYILDRYFHYLLFLSMFLPLHGSPFSSTATDSRSSGWIVSPATITVKFLVLWIYWDAGYGKLMDPQQGWSYYADPLPALDTYARHTLPAQYLYALVGPAGLRLMTPVVVQIELWAAPMALIGAYFGRPVITYTAVALICSLHLGIALTLRNSALLSFVACTVWCTFLPTAGSKRVLPTGRSGRLLSILCIGAMIVGSLWLETISQACDQSVKHIWSTLLHNRWNVFVGAEEYVTWEIAPGLLQDGSHVDVWGRRDTINWNLPGGGAPCTATTRPGRWRSFPYLAGLEGQEGEVLWRYLCEEWDRENHVDRNPGRRLIKYNFFMLQADVLPEMQFSETRKRLVKSFDCTTDTTAGFRHVEPGFMTDASPRKPTPSSTEL